jgi:hypothetical protein
MNLLLNQDELIKTLAGQMLMKKLCAIKITWNNIDAYVEECSKKYQQSGLLEIDFREVNTLISTDIEQWKKRIVKAYKKDYKPIVNWIKGNTSILDKFSNKELVNICVGNEKLSFAAGLGRQLSNKPHWVIEHKNLNPEEPLLIRNIINNEKILQECMQNNREFWFIDSGYTNFLTGKQKIWHRLVKNHIHHSVQDRSFPTDRLSLLPCFPEPWHQSGKIILVVESSPQHYAMKGTTVDQWRTDIQTQIKYYTDRPIEFRSKNPDRKTRSTVYDLLKDNHNYYCVISDSSASAVEAIWCGVPVIILNQHITSTVSRNSISQINDLYRGPLGDWLCALTYSQWTFEELMSGKALKMIRRYSHV